MVCGTPARNGGSNLGRSSGRGGGVAALEAAERLPPSPSDPQMGMDLRKTALLRSLLLRTEVPRPGLPRAALPWTHLWWTLLGCACWSAS
jgi:hypothetical protein